MPLLADFVNISQAKMYYFVQSDEIFKIFTGKIPIAKNNIKCYNNNVQV